jgi:hypothetical protein
MDEVKYLTANYNFPKDRKISSLHSLDELKNTCERIIAEDFGLDGKVSEISDANMVDLYQIKMMLILLVIVYVI